MEEAPIFSHHIFLFPFRWDVGNIKSISSDKLESRINRKEFCNLLDERWGLSEYHRNAPMDYYNSANYFYEFARKAIYAFDGEKSTVLNYRYNLNGLDYNYFIERLMRDGSIKTYKLEVQHLGLNIYDTGIGILSFHLLNQAEHQSSMDDVLAINDFGRRMYPQFLDTSARESSGESKNRIELAQKAFLAKSIRIQSSTEKEPIFFETFEDFENEEKLVERINSFHENLPNTPVKLAEFLGKRIGTLEHSVEKDKKAIIRSILDDRNFVLCWHSNNTEIRRLKGWNGKERMYGYANDAINDKWLQYIFIDNSGNTIQNRLQKIEYAEKHSYARWIDQGTLYGISRYSLVALTNTGSFPMNILRKQIGGGVYFEMAQLLLAQRSSILRFSDEATALASYKFDTSDAKFLHEQYMRFVNKLYFRESTAQEQGIEMYRLLSNEMEIDRDVENLNREIDELDQFVSLKEQSKQTDQATKLTQVATIFLPATLIAGIMGMNTLDTSKIPDYLFSKNPQWPFILSLIFLGVSSFLVLCLFDYCFRLNILFKNKKYD